MLQQIMWDLFSHFELSQKKWIIVIQRNIEEYMHIV